MDLAISLCQTTSYKSRSQIARIATESWVHQNIYCVACFSDAISQAPANSRAVDFRCPACSEGYELKACSVWNDRRIVDAGYNSMIAAIRSDARPNLFVLNYSASWKVDRLVVVPGFAITESVIEKRKPLGLSARRAGWVGCNILIGDIAPDAKIELIKRGGIERDSFEVRKDFARLKPLKQLGVALRGWTLDVLNVIRKLERNRFELRDVYHWETELQEKHPGNRHVRPKIRQQLQVLRDIGVLRFEGEGRYLLIDN